MKVFFHSITWNGQIVLPDYVYFSGYSVNCVSCFMLRHLMMLGHFNTRMKLEFDYLKNEKSFQGEIETIFPCVTSALF